MRAPQRAPAAAHPRTQFARWVDQVEVDRLTPRKGAHEDDFGAVGKRRRR
jgi:hypothetical protein